MKKKAQQLSKRFTHWAGQWKGGRFYFDGEGHKVFLIEKMRDGKRYSIKLEVRDEELALGHLTRFLENPIGYANPKPSALPINETAVFITAERVKAYLESIRHAVLDHRKARGSYLLAWAKLGIDLRTITREELRTALATFEGGHRGRTEALNAFARWLVDDDQLNTWKPLTNNIQPKATRAEREAYTPEILREKYAQIPKQAMRDVFRLRVETGMHFTEISQLEGARIVTGPLPEKGVAIRKLDGKHTIAGVLQVMHKSRERHRHSVDSAAFAAAERLTKWVPGRIHVWEAFEPLIPSNLRHTYATLLLESGKVVSFKGGGIDPLHVQQALGHAPGSTMLARRYAKVQVPDLYLLQLGLTHPDDPPLT